MSSRRKRSPLFLTSILGLTVWIWLLPSLSLSEGYRVKNGDTLTTIAHNYGVTVRQLSAANRITNPSLIRPGRVLVIPERHANIGATTQQPPAAGIFPQPAPARRIAATDDPARIQRLRDGLASGWVVTRNPSEPDKIFVHQSEAGGVLQDLRYLAREGSDGTTWTVYRPARTADGGTRYGQKVGVIDRPTGISIGECSCQ